MEDIILRQEQSHIKAHTPKVLSGILKRNRYTWSYALCFASLFCFSSAYAGTEYVTVVKILDNDDKSIIERKNGEQWLIEKGIGALSFWRYEGKQVLIQSPGLFCGIGSTIILPDVDQSARIWNAEIINSSIPTPSTKVKSLSNEELTLLALLNLGYYEPKSTDKSKSDASNALKSFQKQNQIEETGKISSDTQIALSKAVSKKEPVTNDSLSLASLLLDSAKSLLPKIQSNSNTTHSNTSSASTIETSIDGEFDGWEGDTVVKLMNGQIWQQTEFYYYYHYAYMPDVTIYKSSSGYKMLVDGVPKAIGVIQLP